jgi:putative flippase GtrA
VGIALNFSVFYVAVKLGLGRGSAQLVPLALGSGVAMAFNFIGARRMVFVR